MSGSVVALTMSFGKFAPVTRTYTSGSGTETVPAGATQVVISVWHGGAAGAYDGTGFPNYGGGGGGGGGTLKTIAVIGGNTFSYSVAATVSGRTTTGPGASGNLSTVTGTVSGGSVSLSGTAAGGGQGASIGGTAGTGSGGDTNSNGTAGIGQTGGTGATVGGVSGPGQGGPGGSTMEGGSGGGGAGQITFAYT